MVYIYKRTEKEVEEVEEDWRLKGEGKGEGKREGGRGGESNLTPVTFLVRLLSASL